MPSESQLWKKSGLVVFSIAMMVSAGSAAELRMSEQDKVLWLNENALNLNSQLDADATCEKVVNQSSGARGGEIRKLSIYDEYSNLEKQEDPPGPNASIVFQADSRETGKYFVQLKCEDGREEVESFHIDRMNIEISSPDKKPLYMGSSDQIDVKLTSEEGMIEYSRFDSLEAVIDGANVDEHVLGNQEINFGRETSIRVQNIPNDLTAEDSTDAEIEVTAEYEEQKENGRTVLWRESDVDEIKLKRWNIQKDFKPGQRVSNNRISDINVSLRMSYQGKAVDSLEGRHFYLKRGERNEPGDYEWFSGGHVRNTGDGQFGIYSLSLEKMPQLDVGDHTLDIYFESEEYGPRKVGTVYVEKEFDFDGRVTDSSSRAIDALFQLDSGEYFEEFSTDSRGFFNRRMMPGKYGFNLCFRSGGDCSNSESSFSLQDVEMRRNFSADINYDYFSDFSNLQLDLKGVDPINMMAISFGYPFEQGQGTMRYNPADVEDPAEVSVYECNNWNFFRRSCATEWERLSDDDVQIKPASWTANFPLDPITTDEYGEEKNVLLSAYVVGKKASLRVSRLTVDSYSIRKGDNFNVEGRVVSRGERVEDAEVTVSLMNGDLPVEQVTATSEATGDFSADISADETGNFTVKVEAAKGSYDAFTSELDEEISVYEEKDLSLDVPTQLDVKPGESSTAELEVSNSGQTVFENVRLEAEGPAQIQLSQSSVGRLEQGESQKVKAEVKLPADFCDPSCNQYPIYELTLTGESDGKTVDKSYELQTQVIRESSSTGGSQTEETSQQEDEENNDSATVGGLATGEFLDDRSTTNMALGLIMVFSLALAAAVKKKKSEQGSDRDVDRTVNLQKPEIQPSATLQEDEKIKAVAASIDEGNNSKVVEQEDEKIEELAAAFDEEGEKDDNDNSGMEEPDDKPEEKASADSWLNKLKEQEEVEQDTSGQVQQTEQVEETSEEPEDSTEESQEEAAHSCDVCGEEFDTGSGLNLHKKAMHEDE